MFIKLLLESCTANTLGDCKVDCVVGVVKLDLESVRARVVGFGVRGETFIFSEELRGGLFGEMGQHFRLSI